MLSGVRTKPPTAPNPSAVSASTIIGRLAASAIIGRTSTAELNLVSPSALMPKTGQTAWGAMGHNRPLKAFRFQQFKCILF